jgi:LmbE family N-acetylglucosaminyl deacetylase
MLHTRKVMVLAPHTDDGELGCGASVSKYVNEGKEVIYVAFSSCEQSLPAGLPEHTLIKECQEANKVLGIQQTIILNFEVRHFNLKRQEILDKMIELNQQWKPETVLLPAKEDIHQDHQVIYSEGLRAYKNCNLLGYEMPWNNTKFQPVYFEKITNEQLQTKIAAIKTYRSQANRKYMGDHFIHSLATVRGIQTQSDLAEAFEIYHLSR